MKTLLPFILVLIIVLGIGPWLFFPALTEQPLESVTAAMLGIFQLFIFIPLCIVLGFMGLQEFIRYKKLKKN